MSIERCGGEAHTKASYLIQPTKTCQHPAWASVPVEVGATKHLSGWHLKTLKFVEDASESPQIFSSHVSFSNMPKTKRYIVLLPTFRLYIFLKSQCITH